ncbi:zinc finger protein 845 [Hydra vulgaris]|uniref:Zinc finger protein 845 n=1 Tax=Hydra vulgaris TaxID=6087 RepID=A0ABM4BEI8_HYDVU
MLKESDDLLSKSDEPYNSAFLGADLELDGSRRREISLYRNNQIVLTVEHGVTLGLLKLIYSSDGKFCGTLQGVKSRSSDLGEVASVILSDERVLDRDEYEIIVQENSRSFFNANSVTSLKSTFVSGSQQSNTSFVNSNEKKIGQFVCEYCHLPFVSKAKFLRHRRIHTEINPYVCAHCNQSFSHHLELRKHREETHMTNKSFKCNYCPKSFATRAELRGHLWRHTGEKNHKCRICGKSFATKGNLKLHIDKHIGIHKHKCPFCPQRFTSHSSLESHMAKHTGMKAYKCRFCTKSYAQAGQLTAHERLHTGEKPFLCQVCTKGFRLNSTRLAHEKRHTGVRPHICETCGRSYAMPEHLRRHLKTHENRSDRLVSCPICKKKIFAGRNIRKHLIRHRELNLSDMQAKAIASSLKPDCTSNKSNDEMKLPTCSVFSIKNSVRPPIRCLECNEEVKSVRKLIEHLSDVHYHRELKPLERKEIRLRHGLQKLNFCKYCSSHFVDYRLLRSHVLAEHSGFSDEVSASKTSRKNISPAYKCPSCFSYFHLRSTLDEHIIKDHLTTVIEADSSVGSLLQFQCWYCSVVFETPEDVVSHMTSEHDSLESLSKRVEMSETGENTVTSSGLWTCQHCPVSFKSETEYNSHLILHQSTRSPISSQDNLKLSSDCSVAEYSNDSLSQLSDSGINIDGNIDGKDSAGNVLDVSECEASNRVVYDNQDVRNNKQPPILENLGETSLIMKTQIFSDPQLIQEDQTVESIKSSSNDKNSCVYSDNEPLYEFSNIETNTKKQNKKKISKHLQNGKLEYCGVCFQSFKQSEIQSHSKKCQGEQIVPFRCWFCTLTFNSAEEVVVHMTSQHDNLDNLSRRVELVEIKNMSSEKSNDLKSLQINQCDIKCPICHKTFFNKESFDIHVVTHDHYKDIHIATQDLQSEKDKLLKVGAEFLNKNRHHLPSEQLNDQAVDLTVSRTSTSLLTTSSLNDINITPELLEKSFPLNLANSKKFYKDDPKKISENSIILAQYRNGLNIGVNMCTHCSRVFCGKKALDVHTMKMHGKEYLQRHLTTPSAFPFSCWFCSSAFPTPEKVVEHMTNTHEDLDKLSKRIEEQETPMLFSTSVPQTEKRKQSTKKKYTAIAPHKSMLTMSSISDSSTLQTVFSQSSDISPIINTDSIHQPPPGYKISYALAYVPVFVPDNDGDEIKSKEDQ